MRSESRRLARSTCAAIQYWHAASFAGFIAGGVALATIDLALPIVVAGGGVRAARGLALWVVMPEDHFTRPERAEDERLHHSLIATFKEGMRAVRSHHVLMLILERVRQPFTASSTEGFVAPATCISCGTSGCRRSVGLSRLWWFAILDGGVVADRIGRARARAEATGSGRARRGCAHPGADRRPPRRERGRVRAGGMLWVAHGGRLGGRGAAERAGPRLHRLDQPGAGPEEPRHDQLGRRSGRRRGAGGGGARAGRDRRRDRRADRDRRVGRRSSFLRSCCTVAPSGREPWARWRGTRSTRCSDLEDEPV